MPSLYDIQAAFAAAIFEQDPSRAEGLIVGTDSGERLAVYYNNVYRNFLEALRAVYPVVERLVGERFFAHAASRYIHDTPSPRGDIQCFGASFPAFLASFPPSSALGYLPDTAALEWCMHEVFHAADHSPLSLSQLAILTETDCSMLRFRLHPACRLLASDFPVLKIWQVNQPDLGIDETVDAQAGGELLLIRRPGLAVEVEPLERGEFAMLQALFDGAGVDDAYGFALQADHDFHLGEFIQRRIVDATLVDFSVGPGASEMESRRRTAHGRVSP
ncbi:DUF2063 domain-containing protein [Trinickia symbiotica]|uniref:DUF2063 domain-containing protein n=1 Tax=Trinickia symbiotica TaxID=863227 RepID=A0A2T3XN69_9BURK|nr:DNA-binding domain-containing protein [Trinickia symbiotica]PTB17945.1 DUF2063 domain-containing protein [Trinickia symbiotica]